MAINKIIQIRFHMYQNPTTASTSAKTQIQVALFQKYDLQFNRFRIGPLNYIIHNYTHSPYTLTYKDNVCFADDQELMRRQYKFTTPSGHQQLKDRLQLLTQYYENGLDLLSYEYPTMVITNTEKLFKARRKMKEKMKPIDLSSEFSDSSYSECSLSKTSHFLLSLNHSSIYSELNSQLSSLFIKSSYFENNKQNSYSQYNVYEEEPDQSLLQSREAHNNQGLNIIKQNQNILDNLILDFKEIDEEKLDQQLLKRKKLKEKKSSTAIQIFSIIQEGDRENSIHPSFVPTSPSKKYKQQIQDKKKEGRPCLKDKVMNKFTQNRRDLEQTQRNKGLIKRKAELLLKKLQNEDVNYTIPYDE